MVSLLGDYIYWTGALVINVEVGKSLGAKEYRKVPKILLYVITIACIHSILILLPIIFYLDRILALFGAFSPELILKVRTIALKAFIPNMLSVIGVFFSSYLQTLGMGFYVGLWNGFGFIFTSTICSIYYFNTSKELNTYYILLWLQGLFILLIGIYFYFKALKPMAKIKKFAIPWNNFVYLFKNQTKYAIIEFIDNFDYGLLVYISTALLSITQAQFVAIGYSVLSLYQNFSCAGYRLHIVSLCGFIGEKNAILVKFYIKYSFCCLFGYLLLLNIPTGAIYIFLAPNTSSELNTASNIVHWAFLGLWILGISRTMSLMLLDTMRSTEENFAPIFLFIIGFAGYGFFYGWLDSIGTLDAIKLIWIYLGLQLTKFSIGWLYFSSIDWKKKVNQIKVIE